MNEHTPRRLRGSLLERADAAFHFMPGAVPAEAIQPAPVAPEPIAPVQRAPEPAAVAEPVAAAPEPIAPVEVATPAPEPELVVQAPIAAPTPEPEPVAPVQVAAPEAQPEAEILPADAPVEAAMLRRGFEPELEAYRQPEPEPTPEPTAIPVAEAEPLLLADPLPTPRTSGGRRRAAVDREALSAGGMIVPGGSINALTEEFRMVKRQLLLTARAVAAKDTAKAADRARMILVCSAQPNEGKTFCAINLALSMAAEKDMEILLVDADLAKPDVLKRLGLPEGPGLLDALNGVVAVEDCILDTDIPQLSVLPAGTRTNSDTELLASDRATAVLDGLARANPRRIVIFDSPPVLAASLASVLASHVGQAMLVVRADRTSEGDLREAVATLDGCEHIQLILNSVSFQPGGRRFGNYYEEAGL